MSVSSHSLRVAVAQIGAREHYAIPVALCNENVTVIVVSDFWIPPNHLFCRFPGAKRLRDRFNTQLEDITVRAPNWTMFAFEIYQRLRKLRGWDVNIKRNVLFQKKAITLLSGMTDAQLDNVLFSYSYAAKELFKYAKKHGSKTILGQIDPGPEEERIVAEEHQRYPNLGSRWKPAPQGYWNSWREEVSLADVIIVNSDWSRRCLLKNGVEFKKIEVVPLVYDSVSRSSSTEGSSGDSDSKSSDADQYKVLFLGQINLRKGIARLLEAMRILKDEPVKLTLVGSCEINPDAWSDLPNVEWLGSVPRSEVGMCYQDADLFVLPTLSDGYALTQLEALAYGVPVLASKHCGEAVTHGVNGWILEDLEPETIAEALLLAAKSGLNHVESCSPFSIDDLGRRLVSIMKD